MRRHQEGIAHILRQRQKSDNRRYTVSYNRIPDAEVPEEKEEEESYFGFWCGAVTGAVIGTVAAGLPGLIIGFIVLGNIAHLIDD